MYPWPSSLAGVASGRLRLEKALRILANPLFKVENQFLKLENPMLKLENPFFKLEIAVFNIERRVFQHENAPIKLEGTVRKHGIVVFKLENRHCKLANCFFKLETSIIGAPDQLSRQRRPPRRSRGLALLLASGRKDTVTTITGEHYDESQYWLASHLERETGVT
jgi:hypothetical protein